MDQFIECEESYFIKYLTPDFQLIDILYPDTKPVNLAIEIRLFFSLVFSARVITCQWT